MIWKADLYVKHLKGCDGMFLNSFTFQSNPFLNISQIIPSISRYIFNINLLTDCWLKKVYNTLQWNPSARLTLQSRQRPSGNASQLFWFKPAISSCPMPTAACNPTKWACTAAINIKSEGTSSQINTTAEISTDPTEKHFAEELLTEEFRLLEIAVTTNEFNTFDVSDLKKRIAGHVSRIVLVSAALMISAVLSTWTSPF